MKKINNFFEEDNLYIYPEIRKIIFNYVMDSYFKLKINDFACIENDSYIKYYYVTSIKFSKITCDNYCFHNKKLNESYYINNKIENVFRKRRNSCRYYRQEFYRSYINFDHTSDYLKYISSSDINTPCK
jgi:hypothetical protein